MNRPLLASRPLLTLLLVVCLLAGRLGTGSISIDRGQSRLSITEADATVALSGSGLTSRVASGHVFTNAPHAKQLGHFAWLHQPSIEPGTAFRALAAPRVQLCSAIVLPTSGRSPPSLTL